MLLSETMAIFMTAVALTAAYVFWRSPTMRNAVLLGLACGATALSRTELTLLFPLVVIPLALMVRDADWGRRVRLALVACVMGGIVLGPWIVFNLTRFEETTTMTSGTGSALSAASCDEVWYGRHIGYYANCFQGPWPSPSLDESQRDLVPRKQADRLHQGPPAAGCRSWSRPASGGCGASSSPARPPRSTGGSRAAGGRASWIGLFAYYALWPFAIYGLVLLRRRRIPILPLVAIAVIATFAAAITFGVTRYRAPAEVALVVAAAIGIAGVLAQLA